jgi:hypothetical protein
MAYDPRMAPMSDEGAARAARLLDEGAAILHAMWDGAPSMVRDPEHPASHSPRATLAYARALLDERATLADLDAGERLARADACIHAVLGLQETRPQDAHCGNFRWALEEGVVRDLNGVEFMLDALIPLAREHAGRLPAGTIAAMRDAIRLGLAEIDRLDVHVTYTNIYLSDVCNSVLGGELLDDDRYVERGRLRLDDWLAFTGSCGAPHEYNSPTYLAVDLARMAALAEWARDGSIALRARVAEELLWHHVATHWHPGLLQLAGPHARSYFDGWTGTGGYLKLMLWRVLGDDAIRRDSPYASRTREEGHVGVALDALHPPAYVLRLLRDRTYPFGAVERVDGDDAAVITTHMTEAFALGTASRSYAVGVPREPSLQPNALLLQFRREAPPGFGTLTSRYIINEKHAGATVGGEVIDDLWDEGQALAVQDAGRAIIAYGLRPRDAATHSAKLSLRMLGVTNATEIWAGAERVRDFPARLAPGDAVIVSDSATHVALIPLEPSDMGSDAPIILDRRGDLLTLDIYNYLGLPKMFWEYRTLGGAFFQGNVRNAAIIEVADCGAFADAGVFRAHIEAARIADSVGAERQREITYASGGRPITLRYRLDDMRAVAGNTGDGALGARGGATDGSGMQTLVTSANLVELGGMRVLAGTSPRLCIADADERRYTVVKLTEDEAPMLVETPFVTFDCEDAAFARIEIDEGAGTAGIEADGAIGPVRLTAGVRLIINGADVSGMMTASPDGMREFRGAG